MSIYFIAEIGINHNEILKMVKKLIDASKISGSMQLNFKELYILFIQKKFDSKRESPWVKHKEIKKWFRIWKKNMMK